MVMGETKYYPFETISLNLLQQIRLRWGKKTGVKCEFYQESQHQV